MPIKPESARKISILLVDDREENLISLAAVLDSPDYDLVTATSGQAALRELLARDFALILLDVQMPGMDGFETAAVIRQRQRSKDIPIIFITAISKDEPFVYRGYSAGAVDYIFKPFDPSVLRSKVAVFAELFRKGEALAEANKVVQAQAIERVELENLRRYRDLADAIPHMVVKLRSSGELDFVNRYWREYTGLDARASADDGWRAAVHPDDGAKLGDRFNAGLESRRAFEIECRFKRPGGDFRWFLIRIVPEHSPGRRLIGWLMTGTDIHDRKLTEATWIESVRMRDEFLSIASHELKTPLTPLKLQTEGLIRLIRRGQPATMMPERLMKSLEMMDRQLMRLNRLVDELLDVSKINSGKLALSPAWMDLGDVVHEIIARHAEDVQRSKCEVHVEAPQGVVGYWDRLRIEQVFLNLMTNAVKYAPGKPIHVRIEATGNVARLTVRDEGPGIAPENRERVFRRFERAVSATNYGGLGLGLYIVRQILEAHDGSIELESEIDKGATFRVVIPLRPPRFEREIPPPPAAMTTVVAQPEERRSASP